MRWPSCFKTSQHPADFLLEVMDTMPFGYFYFLENKKEKQEKASHRLTIALRLKKQTFAEVLSHLEPQSKSALRAAVLTLRRKGTPFTLNILSARKTNRWKVSGWQHIHDTQPLKVSILWFEPQSQESALQEKQHALIQALKDKETLFTQGLDCIDMPIWLRNADMSLAYCNQAYVDLSKQRNRAQVLKNNAELDYQAENMSAKLLALSAKTSGRTKQANGILSVDGQRTAFCFTEAPFCVPSDPTERATIGYARDIQKEMSLFQTLQQYIEAQHLLLSALTMGVAIFDANACLQYHNAAFTQLWSLEDEWLSAHPTFGQILDKLRDLRLIPEEADFTDYKHQELDAFATVTQPTEDMIFLPSGRVIKRTMTPYLQGGLVMMFDDVTDRIAMERDFNEQMDIQKTVINHLPEGIVLFNNERRIKLYNSSYEDFFKRALPTVNLPLDDFLEAQHKRINISDDLWPLHKQKILSAIENKENPRLQIPLIRGGVLRLSIAYLPDGGFMLSYEKLDQK